MTTPHRPDEADPASAARIRVLIVDDSARDADLLLRELRMGGFDPEERRVETEAELRTALRDGPWDVALCDWLLPGFSAPQAIEVLQESGFTGPVIIVSGQMGEAHVVEAMHSGADDYVEKSDLLRLSPAVERQLRETEMRLAGDRAAGHLIVSEARLRTLVHAIPATTYVTVASRNGDGDAIKFISSQITGMSGYPPEAFMRDPGLWLSIVHPDDRDAARLAGENHFATDEPLHREYRVVARDERVVWLRDEATMLAGTDGHPKFSQGLLTDITEAKAAEVTLRRQALIFETMHDAVVVVDPAGRILDLNPGAEMMFGYTSDEARGRLPDFLSVVDVTAAIMSAVADDGRWSGELPFVTKTGEIRIGELIAVPMHDADDGQVGAVGVVRDITDRKEAEHGLQRTVDLLRASDRERRLLLSRLVTAREEEAQRIAGELHDDPLQKLTALALRLGTLGPGTDPETQTRTIVQIQRGLDDTMTRLRHMLFELSPRSLETGGLGAALSEYVLHANQEEDLRYRLVDELDADLSMETRTIAYRVILEALANVRKHAAATQATVRLWKEDGWLHCAVSDDGQGIPPVRLGATLPGHMGNASMRQRVALAGGTIEIESELGHGTMVHFSLPIGEAPR